jgi:hypothetical protein
MVVNTTPGAVWHVRPSSSYSSILEVNAAPVGMESSRSSP